MDIEVVIPCYNHEQYLEQAIESVVAQCLQLPIGVTMVDDGSTDSSYDQMLSLRDNYQSRTMKFKILRNPKSMKQWFAINQAVQATSRQLILILNADDILAPDCFERTADAYSSHREIFLFGGEAVPFQGARAPAIPDKHHSHSGPTRVIRPDEALRFTHVNDLHVSHASSSFFKVAWEVVGGYFPPRRRVCLFDDRDFQLRVSTCFPVGVANHPMVFYRTDSSQGRGFL